RIEGYLQGGIQTWKEAGRTIDMVISITPEEFALDFKHSQMNVLDVRKPGEWDTCHLDGARFISLQDLPNKMDQLSTDETYYVHCAGGYRSMIAASVLKKNGFERIKNVYGGWG